MSTSSSSAVRIDSLWGWARATQALLFIAGLSNLVILICLGVGLKRILDLQAAVAGGQPSPWHYDEVDRFNRQLESITLATEAAAAVATISAACLAIVLTLATLTSAAWLNIAWSNLRTLVARPAFSPAIASLLWLFPGLNVIASYFVLDQLWKQSGPEQATAKREGKQVLLLAWWLCTLAVITCAGFVISQKVFLLPGKELVERGGGHQEALISVVLELAVVACGALAIWLMFWIIGSITHDQAQRFSVMRGHSGG